MQLFEGVARLVQAWAWRTSVVLFLDDLHWADTASLDLPTYLLTYWQERAMPMLLLSLRSEAVSPSSPLAAWKTNVEQRIASAHMELVALSAKQTQEVVEALAGGAQPAVSQRVE